MSGKSIASAIICAISFLILIIVCILDWDIFSNIASSSDYTKNNNSKSAHSWFLVAFVLNFIVLVFLTFIICLIGFRKLHKVNLDSIKEDYDRLIEKAKTKKLNAIETEELKKDKKILKHEEGGSLKLSISLFCIGLLSLLVLILNVIGQYYLGKALQANNQDPNLIKAKSYGWWVIGLGIVTVFMIAVIVALKIMDYVDEKKMLTPSESSKKTKKSKKSKKETKVEEKSEELVQPISTKNE
jgi:Na+-transporting methylmalonyl-CoA/oxaloacetate decarboxylase gamma subunit